MNIPSDVLIIADRHIAFWTCVASVRPNINSSLCRKHRDINNRETLKHMLLLQAGRFDCHVCQLSNIARGLPSRSRMEIGTSWTTTTIHSSIELHANPTAATKRTSSTRGERSMMLPKHQQACKSNE